MLAVLTDGCHSRAVTGPTRLFFPLQVAGSNLTTRMLLARLVTRRGFEGSELADRADCAMSSADEIIQLFQARCRLPSTAAAETDKSNHRECNIV